MAKKQQSKTKRDNGSTKQWEFRTELMDELLAGYEKPSDLTGPDGMLQGLIGALVSRAMQAEMTDHLGYEHGAKAPEGETNRRNGKGRKTLRTGHGPVEVEVPRDRESTFEPQIVGKHDRSFNGFDDKIISMYARGMSTREIRDHLAELYGVEVSAELVSRVTDEVVDELKAWQSRPLEAVYLVVYLDALVVKIRDKTGVRNKSVYLAVGVRTDGHKEVLGMWIEATEGAKFWLTILGELRQRGVADILVICADGLTGLPQAVEAAFPKAVFQTCIVHLVRSSVRYVPWKNRRAVCRDLRIIYTADSAEGAEAALDDFEAKWGDQFPMIAPAWRRRWAEVTPFLSYPIEIRRAIYTTNAIEALNRQLRKVLKTRGHMPSDQAALKLIYLALRNATKKWGAPFRRTWQQALLQFAIHFGDRLPD
jgi:putative transposase